MKTPTVRMHLWLESGESVYFGMGRLMLLDRIEEYGSLRKAAESLGMSYRAAWGKLRATEDAVGEELVETLGTKRGGYRLTPAGRRFRDKFSAWFEAVEKTAVAEAREIFTQSVQSYSEKKIRPHGAGYREVSAEHRNRY
ncbi:LysR family transcriptional regulator [Desulfomicrobium sp. ZS1]|jgi:molybdate transport system regulatory protein|uniref:winged helix-turn-helix domain-containing protein n=1 Tax=Desulfomicrobium sp. ZS1 TaxID=2952228 RepID=UPI0020B19DE5|nr:LysR family transcriptional regulator [Desulfomicrobium sp. ZS1]UTF51471.1 LysR family transcriptional regulator [Desulfomicrobium sp. ZS1]